MTDEKPGARANGKMADGARADGELADGEMADGARADGELADGEMADGAMADGARADEIPAAAASEALPATDDRDADGVTTHDRVIVRRAPRFARFIILGAGLGAIVTFILTAIFPVDPDVGFAALFGYFASFGVPAGVAFGALVAIAFDSMATRRAKQVDAERTRVDAVPEEIEGDLED